MSRLPDGFAELERWVEDWVLPDSRARAAKRQATAFVDIRAFYDALLPHAPRALATLAECRLGHLTEAEETLLKLMLSLAEIGPAVEWYGQAEVIDGFPAARFTLVEQILDNAAQE